MRSSGDFSKWAKQVDGYTQHGNIKGEKKNAIYEAVKKDTGDKELAARVANRQGKPGKQHQGPPYSAPIKGASYTRSMLKGAAKPDAWKEVMSLVRAATSPGRKLSPLFKAPGSPLTVARPDWIPAAQDSARALESLLMAPLSKMKQQAGRVVTASEVLKGGLADNKSNKDFNPEELAKGKKTELEHTDSSAMAEEISRDHLTEDPKYYSHLKEMEKKYKGKEASPITFQELHGMVAASRRLGEKKFNDANGDHKQQPNRFEDHKQASARRPGDFFSFLAKSAGITDYAGRAMVERALAGMAGGEAALARQRLARRLTVPAAALAEATIPGATALVGGAGALASGIGGPVAEGISRGLRDAQNLFIRRPLAWARRSSKRLRGIKPKGWVE